MAGGSRPCVISWGNVLQAATQMSSSTTRMAAARKCPKIFGQIAAAAACWGVKKGPLITRDALTLQLVPTLYSDGSFKRKSVRRE